MPTADSPKEELVVISLMEAWTEVELFFEGIHDDVVTFSGGTEIADVPYTHRRNAIDDSKR